MASPLKRGFSAKANRKALELRKELGVDSDEPLDPAELARHLGVLVLPLSALSGTPEIDRAVNRLTVHDTPAFSGCCIQHEGKFAIVVNDAHSAARQAATIAHELAHIILGHETEQHFADGGMREFNEEKEAEADRLGDSLLVPDETAKVAIFKHGTLEQAADHFGISMQLMRKRFNMSGGQAILKRSGKKVGSR